MYTIRPDKPVNPVLLEILSKIQVVTGELGCDYLLVGATARDISALAALKLLAWDDRGLQDNKDAQDLLFLLQHYHEAGNGGRMYEEAFELLEAAGFDLPLAGATLLAILADPRKRDRLLVHMTRSAGIESDMADKLLSQFELGLRN